MLITIATIETQFDLFIHGSLTENIDIYDQSRMQLDEPKCALLCLRLE